MIINYMSVLFKTAKPITYLSYSQEVVSDAPVRYFRLNDLSGTSAIAIVGTTAGNYSGGVTLNQTGFVNGGKSVLFNAATSGKINTNLTTDYTTAVSLECFFNAAATGHDAGAFLICKNQYYATGHAYFPISLSWDRVNSKVVLGLSKGNDYAQDLTMSSPLLSANTDYHVVAVYRANGLCEMYINGVLTNSAVIDFIITTTGNYGIPWTIASPTELGGGTGNGSFNGRIGEVAIYDKALLADRILSHYNARVV